MKTYNFKSDEFYTVGQGEIGFVDFPLVICVVSHPDCPGIEDECWIVRLTMDQYRVVKRKEGLGWPMQFEVTECVVGDISLGDDGVYESAVWCSAVMVW